MLENENFLNQVRQKSSQEDCQGVYSLIKELHPADIAKVLDMLEFHLAVEIIKIFEPKKASEIILEIDQKSRIKVFECLSSELIVDLFLKHMESDDVADILLELEDQQREKVIKQLDSKTQMNQVLELLTYDKDSAGGLMAKELVKINLSWTVAQAIDSIKQQTKYMARVLVVYVVDELGTLKGRVSVKKILFAPPNKEVKDLYSANINTVHADEYKEEVARIMYHYNLVALPVVGKSNELLGIISIDDVVEVIKEEAQRDFQLAAGITEQIEAKDSAFTIIRARIPWLLLGLLGGLISSQIVSSQQLQLSLFPQMVFFIPLIAAMGGNVGVQSSAIIVQSLANNTFFGVSIKKRLLKDVFVSFFNALVCSLVLFVYNIIAQSPLSVTLTISLALFSVIIFAAITGSIIPIILNRLKVDPALATGPFITTINDIIGLFIYFFIGYLLNT